MADEDIDFGAAGLLDGLEGAEREERLALLRQLTSQGFRSRSCGATSRPGGSCSCSPTG